MISTENRKLEEKRENLVLGSDRLRCSDHRLVRSRLVGKYLVGERERSLRHVDPRNWEKRTFRVIPVHGLRHLQTESHDLICPLLTHLLVEH